MCPLENFFCIGHSDSFVHSFPILKTKWERRLWGFFKASETKNVIESLRVYIRIGGEFGEYNGDFFTQVEYSIII